MRGFAGVVASELLKLKRSPALLTSIVAPYVVVLLVFFVVLGRGEQLLAGGSVSPWFWMIEVASSVWSQIFLPPFLGLVAALAGATEHRARGYKHLFALAVPRWQVLGAKLVALGGLVWLSSLLLAVGLLVAGLGLRWLVPGLGLEASPPWALLAGLTFGLPLAAGFALALHAWVAAVRPDFSLSVGLGFMAMVIFVSSLSMAPELATALPWGYPGKLAAALVAGESVAPWLAAGVAGGVGFGVVAFAAVARRDVD